jgi:hypothetical protein
VRKNHQICNYKALNAGSLSLDAWCGINSTAASLHCHTPLRIVGRLHVWNMRRGGTIIRRRLCMLRVVLLCRLGGTGHLDAAGERSSPACKVAYPNRDTYFGPYAAGAKAGTGLYVAANGAAYVGQYAAGKRSGFGLMILPDGGLYKGGFKDDKFDGQVG